MSSKKWWIKNEVTASIIVPVLFLIIGFFVAKMYFAENAYPVDYEMLEPSDWADKFFSIFTLSTLVCIIYNIAIAVIGVLCGKHSRVNWCIYAVLTLLIPIIFIMIMSSLYGEESGCTYIMGVLFFFEYIFTFVISTYCCPKHWDFFPFAQ